MPFSMPKALCDASTGANGIICIKIHVSPYFDHYDLINAMVPLTTELASQLYVWILSRHV